MFLVKYMKFLVFSQWNRNIYENYKNKFLYSSNFSELHKSAHDTFIMPTDKPYFFFFWQGPCEIFSLL